MIQGKVLGSVLDENGNIKVGTEYTLTDGSKKIGHTRYNWLNFSKERVLADVKTHCETLMKKVYGLKRHQALIQTNLSKIAYECTQAEVITKPEIRDLQGNIITPAETLVIEDK